MNAALVFQSFIHGFIIWFPSFVEFHIVTVSSFIATYRKLFETRPDRFAPYAVLQIMMAIITYHLLFNAYIIGKDSTLQEIFIKFILQVEFLKFYIFHHLL